jgi:ribosomal protein S18 acetylase RimI-like enzyme
MPALKAHENNLFIRGYDPSDAARLRELWVAAWNAVLPDIDFTERQNWFVDWLAAHLAAGGVVECAVDAVGEVIGFTGFDPSTGHVEQLAVHPSASGRGVGRALLDAAKTRCPEGLTLRANQENSRAIEFYRKAGFVVVAEGVNPGGQRPIYDMAWKPM